MKKVIFVLTLILSGVLFFTFFQKEQPDEVSHTCYYPLRTDKLYCFLDGNIQFPLAHIIQDDINFDHPYFHKKDESIVGHLNLFGIDKSQAYYY